METDSPAKEEETLNFAWVERADVRTSVEEISPPFRSPAMEGNADEPLQKPKTPLVGQKEPRGPSPWPRAISRSFWVAKSEL